MRRSVPLNCLRCSNPIRPRAASPESWPNTRQHAGRGLCYACREKSKDDDTLLDYPRLKQSHQDIIEDLAELREQGLNTRPAIEKRMGTAWPTIYQAVYRTGRQDLLVGLPHGGRGDRRIGDTDITAAESRGISRAS